MTNLPPPPFGSPPPDQGPPGGTPPQDWLAHQPPPQGHPLHGQHAHQQPFQPSFQQPFQHAPAAGPQPAGPGLGLHLKRAIDWNVREIELTDRERQQLTSAGVIEPRLQQLLVWRRSTLLMAVPVLVLTVLLKASEAFDVDTEGFTALGHLVNWLPVIGVAVMPIVSIYVISRSLELARTSRMLVLGWIGSILLPLVAALIPLDLIIDLDLVRAQRADADALILSARLQLAVQYAMILLPVVISVPAGVLKGAARVKSIFPAAQLPGWFLVAVAPFYSMFMIVTFVLIEQLVGNILLLLGIGLLAFAPWLYVIHRQTYWRPMTAAQAEVELTKASRSGGYITGAGLVIVVLFLFTAKVGEVDVIGGDDDSAFFTYVQIGRTFAEVISRGFVTTVVLCLIFLNMVFREWQINRSIPEDVRQEHEVEMWTLSRYESRHAPGQPPPPL